ncbi:MAG: acyl-ACP--UDP-N-acetylglucosamine O-acyltransferase [Alphaproteobacteria bacterium]|nr:acyl-ACP--UDP-N-acetylglucosamine O-acyltransferase [Alphaproteobacteria bacterium]
MTETKIHPTAVVDPAAVIGAGVVIGPYCIVGPHVKLADNVQLRAHVYVDGYTSIGEGTIVYPFTSLGTETPDLKYKGEPSALIIGKNCRIREHVTMNPGTEAGIMRTVVGDNCLFMPGSHVAHDCIVGNNVIMANHACMGGHVEVGDFVVFGGLSAAHQFVRIGSYAMIGGMAGVKQDVIPYGIVAAQTPGLAGLNYIGLERRGYSKEQVKRLMAVFRRLFDSEGTLDARTSALAQEFANDDDIMRMIGFVQGRDNRPILQPLKTGT